MVDEQYRGLLTDREQEILRGDDEVTADYYSRVKSRIRNKIDLLGDDLQLLQMHEPSLADELQDELCNDEQD